MSGLNDSLMGAFRPVYTNADGTVAVSTENADDLSTTAVQLTNFVNATNRKIRRLRVKNWSDSNRLGVHFVEIGASTPTIDTVLDDGNAAHLVLAPGEIEYLTINADVEVWVVGSAAGTEYQVTWFE